MNIDTSINRVAIVKTVEERIHLSFSSPDGSSTGVVLGKGYDANGDLWWFKYDSTTDHFGNVTRSKNYGFSRV